MEFHPQFIGWATLRITCAAALNADSQYKMLEFYICRGLSSRRLTCIVYILHELHWLHVVCCYCNHVFYCFIVTSFRTICYCPLYMNWGFTLQNIFKRHVTVETVLSTNNSCEKNCIEKIIHFSQYNTDDEYEANSAVSNTLKWDEVLSHQN